MTDPQGAGTVIHETPLAARHEALGARMIDFAGWRMPVQYGSILDEHRSVRERAGLFDLSHMGELLVEGPDAGDALATALVSDPPSLAVGRAHYSMICAPNGGIIDDLIVYRIKKVEFLLVVNGIFRAVASRIARADALRDGNFGFVDLRERRKHRAKSDDKDQKKIFHQQLFCADNVFEHVLPQLFAVLLEIRRVILGDALVGNGEQNVSFEQAFFVQLH